MCESCPVIFFTMISAAARAYHVPTRKLADASLMVKVLVPVANGSEEIETTCITDTLVRAGAEVVIASVEGLQCKMSRGFQMTADVVIGDVAATEFDCIAIPGGMPGAKTIGECAPFIEILKKHVAAGKLYGAICAAPAVALLPHGLIPDGSPATCHPGFAEKLAEGGVAGGCSEERVVKAGKLITSRGPGTAIEFALALIEQLFGAEKATAVAGPMLVKM